MSSQDHIDVMNGSGDHGKSAVQQDITPEIQYPAVSAGHGETAHRAGAKSKAVHNVGCHFQ
jgi:hypothetical protein